jgi:hypothetical protein
LFGLDERLVRKDVEHGVFGRGKRPPRFAWRRSGDVRGFAAHTMTGSRVSLGFQSFHS